MYFEDVAIYLIAINAIIKPIIEVPPTRPPTKAFFLTRFISPKCRLISVSLLVITFS